MVSNKELESFWRFISSSVGHIFECLEGLNEDDLNWRPLDNANSLYVLTTHTMGNIEENILGVLCEEKIIRQRDEEFKAKGNSIEPIQQRWHDIQERISSNLPNLSTVELNQQYEHPHRGRITGHDILIVVARHAAEHMGQAQLTRDLLFTNRGRTLPVREY